MLVLLATKFYQRKTSFSTSYSVKELLIARKSDKKGEHESDF